MMTYSALLDFERSRLSAAAQAALSMAPRTLVTAINPRSPGGPHDFSSEADYWWPDPANPDGPYIQRDGMTNPDNFTAHRELMLDFATHVGHLAGAWQCTGEGRFAERAVAHMRAWFCDPATRMNPHLEYAQAIGGVCTGRGIGLIDTVHLAEVALALELLRHDKAMCATDDEMITRWFSDYLQWFRTHPYGIDESNTDNNHSVCWTLQAAAFARATRNQAVLEECRQRFTQVLLPGQMALDGSFPRELGRTKPYGYSIFNLDVMSALALVISSEEFDALNFRLPDGRSVIRGIEFLAPYLADKGQWPYSHDVMYWTEWPIRQPALLFGALSARRADWLSLWGKLPTDPTVFEVRRNYPVRNPGLWLGRSLNVWN
ncbi:alginate lyase family protein [Uliginosibacterium sp. sgz301328]|uniref:alginate lyase family protein n=1 Tax=Uliginosibacterium sp. sgz301328 TaxID=3243764 RepID=UPI00359DDA1A